MSTAVESQWRAKSAKAACFACSCRRALQSRDCKEAVCPGISASMKKHILVVEDEEKLRRVIELQLASAGFEVEKAGTAEQGLKVVDRADLVLTDLRLPGMDGLDLLAKIRQQNTVVPVIIMTAFGSIETAVEAMKI